MIRKNLIKSLSVVMATMLAVMTVACGQATTDTQTVAAVEESAEEAALEDSIVKNSVVTGTESDAGKVETVYVTADANGAVNDVIVSEWLKNATASSEIADSTELKNIVNVKGDETFKDNGDGTLTWDAEGSDIFYQGTTDKELPVNMKITYTLDGKEISPEELAGKSGRVTIRFEYENNAKKTVNVDGKDIEVYTPFAMVSGMMLDADKFTNVEISNGKVISDGGNYVVMGVALPGLKESLDISDDKWDKLDDADEIKEKLSNSFEITADTSDFELGMTITMASSDILSDFGLTDITGSDKIADLKSDMGDLNDGGNKLVDGAQALMDGAVELKDGTGELYDGTTQLYDGTGKLYDGAGSLADGTGKLYEGTVTLRDGAGTLASGTATLRDGISAYTNGVSQVNDGAVALSKGVNSAKQGSEALKAGAGQLAEGATKMNEKVGGIGQLLPAYKTKINGLTEAMNANVTALTAKRAKLVKTQNFLATGQGWDSDVAEMMAMMAGHEVSAEDATKLVLGAQATLAAAGEETPYLPTPEEAAAAQSAQASTDTTETTETGSVDTPDNFDELVQEVETDTITEDDKEPEVTEPVVTEPVTIVEEEAPKADVPATTTLDLTNVEPAGDDTVVTTSLASESDGEKSAAEYEALIEELQKQLVEAQTAAKTYGEQAKAAQAAAEEYGAKAKAAADGMQSYYNAAKKYRDGVVSLKTGVGAVSKYEQLVGATDAAIKAIDETLASLGNIGLNPEELAGIMTTIDSKAVELMDGTKALADGANQVYGGVSQLDGGLQEISAGADKLAAGTGTLVSKNGELNDGANKLADGANKLSDGTVELNDGAGQLNSGAKELLKGAGDLNDGAKELNDGAKQLDDGVVTLEDGMQQLLDGVVKLDEEGIKRLYEAFDGDLSDFADRMSAIQEAGKSYSSFGGSSEEENSSVKFIFKTDSVKSL
jgi:putative membrane protein